MAEQPLPDRLRDCAKQADKETAWLLLEAAGAYDRLLLLWTGQLAKDARLERENQTMRSALEAVVHFWERDTLAFGDEATPTTLAGRFADVARSARAALGEVGT